MSGLLPQIILAARRYDEDAGWMQLLVFVIMAVFWALGSIIKSRSKKTGFEEEEGQLKEGQLEETFPEHGQQMSQQTTRPQQKKDAQPRHTARHVTAKKETLAQPQTLKSLEIGKLSLKKTEIKTEQQEIPSEQSQPQTGIEFPLDLEDADNLKRAVVYYEVLGKPLAMRDEPKNII